MSKSEQLMKAAIKADAAEARCKARGLTNAAMAYAMTAMQHRAAARACATTIR